MLFEDHDRVNALVLYRISCLILQILPIPEALRFENFLILNRTAAQRKHSSDYICTLLQLRRKDSCGSRITHQDKKDKIVFA